MRTRIPLVLCLLLVSPAFASTDPFADFRIPDHSWTSGQAGFALDGNHSLSAYGSETDRSIRLGSSLSGSLSRSHDSDALQHELTVDLLGALATSNSRYTTDWNPGSVLRDDFARDVREDWRVSGSLRAYPWQTPIGTWLSASVAGDYAQEASRRDLNEALGSMLSEERDTRDRHVCSHAAALDVAVGYGRVRDATVVYDVHLLEERLREAGALRRPLSSAAREKLAALYYVAPFYSAAHDRPDRFVWRDIERILREDGALSDQGLDAYSVLRAREATSPRSRPERARGWFAGAAAEASHAHAVTREEQRSDSRFTPPGTTVTTYPVGDRIVQSADEVLLGGQAEIHRPLGWRWQADASASALRPVRPGERGLDAHVEAAIQWFIADRWAAKAFLSQWRQYFHPRDGADPPYGLTPSASDDAWRAASGASLAYYLEDRTSLSLSFSEMQWRQSYGGGSVFSRYGSFGLGISYRFLGGLDAPGIIEPVRPTR
jgi:hypothetical protein